MPVKTYQKPKYVPENTLVATKSGWCYTPNHNEVLVAVGYLDEKLADQGLDNQGNPTEEPVVLANTIAPVISGTFATGEVLSVTSGTWTGTAPITYAYLWQTSTNGTTWTSLGVTTTTYTVKEEDATNSIRVVVTATDSSGSVSAESNVFIAT